MLSPRLSRSPPRVPLSPASRPRPPLSPTPLAHPSLAHATPLGHASQIRDLHEASGGKLLSFFNVGAESMSTSILRAIVANLTASPSQHILTAAPPKEQPTAATRHRRGTLTSDDGHDAFAKALLLAVRWDRPEIAKPILVQIAARGTGFASGTMQRALQASQV